MRDDALASQHECMDLKGKSAKSRHNNALIQPGGMYLNNILQRLLSRRQRGVICACTTERGDFFGAWREINDGVDCCTVGREVGVACCNTIQSNSRKGGDH